MLIAVIVVSACAVVCCLCVLGVASLRFVRTLEAQRQQEDEPSRALLAAPSPQAEADQSESTIVWMRETHKMTAALRLARASRLEDRASEQEAAGDPHAARTSRMLAWALRDIVKERTAQVERRFCEIARLQGSVSAAAEGVQRRRSFVKELRAAADRLDAKAYQSSLGGYPAAAESKTEQATALRAAAEHLAATGELPDWVPQSVIEARVAELKQRGGKDETEASDRA